MQVTSLQVVPGSARLVGDPEVSVRAFYQGDDNLNGRVLIEWGLDGVDFTLGSFLSPLHPASPYAYLIKPLDNSKVYQVRVTFQDGDNTVNPVHIVRGKKPFNPMLHNAVSTGSANSKWPNGWGTADPGSQYGEFDCRICHQRKSGNIKRVRRDWSDPALPDVPAKVLPGPRTIDYQDNRDGSAQYALDDSLDHAVSNRICEACHTRTSFHRHDMSASGGGDHNSSRDCRSCHNHQRGFAASGCNGCHGGGMLGATERNFWPDSVTETLDTAVSANDAGEHRVHMTLLAERVYGYSLTNLLDSADSDTEQKTLCAYCHVNPGSDADHMSGDDAEVSAFRRIGDGLADADPAGVFNPVAGTCASIDCHNGKTTPPAQSWYAGGSSSCLMCHTEGAGNLQAVIDPRSGLHTHAAPPAGVEVHDGSFSSGGNCLSCHTTSPSSGHFNAIADSPATATYAFQSSGVDVRLGVLADNADGTCAASCHSDAGAWYRRWSAEAFDATPVVVTQTLPARCNVCHGKFGTWAEGSSHAGTAGGSASSVGSTHNSQNPSVKPGAACEDCHVFPTRSDLHDSDGRITLNNDPQTVPDPAADVDPVETTDGTYCLPCHSTALADLPPAASSVIIPGSTAFDTLYVDGSSHYPIGSCFSGAVGCHGDTSQHWWPVALEADPTPWTGGDGINHGYPNRAGAHVQHNQTIGKLIAETRTGNPSAMPTDADFNATCRFCHPMVLDEYGVWKSPAHRNGITEMYGGYRFPTANDRGVVLAGNPATDSWITYDSNPTDGYLYQLDNPFNPGSLYPLDTDATYRQYLYGFRSDSGVNHGTCAQVACHSNAPFTPQWYGDHQAPAKITDLTAFTHNPDVAVHNITAFDDPGTAHLYWTAPGDNGNLSGTAYEYEVYYRSAGAITDANLASATRAGGSPSILHQGDQQDMVVDGLTPGTNYWFAVVTKDQPTYSDLDLNNIYDTFVADGLRSLVGSAGPVAAHVDDVAPVFWGVNQAQSHDTGGTINLSWGAARDHTLPITYQVYWSEYSLKTHLARGGVLPVLTKPAQYNGGVYSYGFTEGTPPVPGGTDYYISASTTSGLSYQASGMGAGVLYNFIIKAEDGKGPGIGNVDKNTVVAMALAKTLPQEAERTVMGVLSGATGLVQTDPLSPTWGSTGSVTLANNASVTFTDTADLDGATTRETWVQGISIDLTVKNDDRKLAQAFSVQLGYNNGSFVPLGSPVAVGIGRKASRVMKIGLSPSFGTVPANAKLAVRITSTVPASGSTGTLTFSWGSSTLKGQLMVTAQPVNHQPSAPVFGPLSRSPGGYINITWTPANDGTPGDGGQTMHYDLLGSADNGVTWPYVIGTGLTNANAVAGVRWDTVGDGLDRLKLPGTFSCRVKIAASDGYLYELTPGSGVWTSHREVTSGMFTVDNRYDDEAPAAVTINHVEPRPKQGAAFLHWVAVGNDGYNHGTRAAYYDIRFRKTSDGSLSTNWNDVKTVRAAGEPVPDFAGKAETFELLNMTPDTSHAVAIVTCDAGEDNIAHNADDNCSALSNVYTITSGQYYCGICHSTPPDEPYTKGIHRQHGYTLEDCAKCHGDGTGPDDGLGPPGPNNVNLYDGRHYDGVINIGWAKDASGNHLLLDTLAAGSGGSGVTVNQGGLPIYQDPDGAGGYNAGTAYNPGSPNANTDSGRCMNFIGANANGCHGPFSPQWAPDTLNPNPAEPHCADCHGDQSAARDLDPYGRTWDENVAGAPAKLVLASPPQANHGGTTTTDRYVGAHEVHLNSSFRFAKGDSCRLCHRDVMELDLHADGKVDVRYDVIADFDQSTPATIDQGWTEVNTKGASCGSLNNTFCHDTGANWAEPGAKCNSCHGMHGKDYNPGDPISVDKTNYIGHVWDKGVARECIHCHVAGHPQSPDGHLSGASGALLVNNNAAVGINYRSGGIHLRQHTGNPGDPNGAVAYRTTYSGGAIDTLAETCWGCHEDPANDISEWGTNASAATGNSNYNFGTLNQRAWTGAIWLSGYGQTSSDPFWYKRGRIQSTHTTDPTGTSQVVWDSVNGRYNETADPIDKIRCSNCHDVHDSNQAPGDTMTGRPYLRGTWKSNPYEEDGAPWATKTYTQPSSPLNYWGAVPRAMDVYNELGGFYIDQNNVKPGTGRTTRDSAAYPTSGWTVQSSAGLCVLCHGDNVDEMDQRLPAVDAVEANLWLGSNGHSNSVLGGDFSRGANIFDFSHGRPSPVIYNWGVGRPTSTAHYASQVPDMAYTNQGEEVAAGGGYRGPDANAGKYAPLLTTGRPYAYNYYTWGASIDASTTDNMYHQFSCSKCHNPHASRLPKLMITNCLDIRHNTWDDSKSSQQNTFTATALNAVDRGMPAAYYASAQNCHRFDPARGDVDNNNIYETRGLRGGWNLVTPWVKDNLSNLEHKGSLDPAYNTSNATTPWRHSDFPIEPARW